MKTVGLHTFGCKLNFSETSTLIEKFKSKGYKKTSIYNNPSQIIINTCSVTENADKKCSDLVKKIRRKSPKSKITVIGCFAQLKPNKIIQLEGVDKVIGSENKFNIDSYFNEEKIIYSPIQESRIFHSSFSTEDRTRAFLKVQDGCNYGCAFCTIPLARGKSRSAEINQIIKNIYKIIDKGIKEVVLSGINIGDFGIINNRRKHSLIQLLEEINRQIKNIRIRISSIEPNLLNDDIIELISKSKTFVKHFHIPLQSGSNKILNDMSRRYTKELYYERVTKIKTLMPDACIGGDVIVGFPGENENEFNKTLEFLKKIDMSYLHVFPYSERPNTRALNKKNIIPIEIRNERSKILRMLSEKKKRFFYNLNLKTTREVIFENKKIDNYMYGFTDNYIKTKIKFDENLIGKNKNVYLNKIDSDCIVQGKIL